MFTGIIEHAGRILDKSPKRGEGYLWKIEAPFSADLNIGDSVNINGACHTITRSKKGYFEVFSSLETLSITNLKDVNIQEIVNLERAMGVGGRFDGHWVYGHIDITTRLAGITPGSSSTIFTFELEAECAKYIISKGSIAINGVSLTIYEKKPYSFQVMIIPHTLNNTNFKEFKLGQLVNIEWDIVGKYLENFLHKVS